MSPSEDIRTSSTAVIDGAKILGVEAADYKESPSRGAAQPGVPPQDPRRPPLSAVLITLNAASQLEACLASLAFADEILVVDSGSSDATVEIAQRHGARVLQQAWLGFGPQKQFAVQQAAHEWVLCLDADERISPALFRSISEALGHQRSPARYAWKMARANVFMGRVLRHGEGYPDWSLRLFHRDHARWSDDPVHESVLVPPGTPVGTLAGDLMHESSETLSIYLAKQNRYTDLQAQRLFAAGKRAGALRIALAPVVRFFKFYVFRRGFLDGVPGLVHILIGCQNSMLKYAKLRELHAAAPE